MFMTAERPFRLPDVKPENYTPEQKRASDEILEYVPAMGVLRGISRACVRNPKALQALTKFIQVETEAKFVSQRVNRLIGILQARYWTGQFEWFAQANMAVNNGLDPSIIEAIRFGREPAFANEDEHLAYDIVTEMHRTHALSDATFERARVLFGDDGFTELVIIASFFEFVGMVDRAFMFLAPEPSPAAPLPEMPVIPA